VYHPVLDLAVYQAVDFFPIRPLRRPGMRFTDEGAGLALSRVGRAQSCPLPARHLAGIFSGFAAFTTRRMGRRFTHWPLPSRLTIL
jgi:hypothetical protein